MFLFKNYFRGSGMSAWCGIHGAARGSLGGVACAAPPQPGLLPALGHSQPVPRPVGL